MAKDVGAKKVIVASCAPPIRSVSLLSPHSPASNTLSSRYANVYGIDMPSRTELVAHNRSDYSVRPNNYYEGLFLRHVVSGKRQAIAISEDEGGAV